MVNGRVELDLDVVESAAQRGIDGGVTGKRGSDAGPKKAVIEAGKEQSGTETSVSDAVAEAFGQSLDHAVETEATELVANSALADRIRRTAGEIGEMLAQIAAAEAVRE